MAAAVEFRQYTPHDSREDLRRKLEAAPMEHAEALLELYALLEKMHDKDVLATLNGLLAARNTVADKLSDVLTSKEVINLLRLGLIGVNVVRALEPDKVHELLGNISRRPPSLWQTLRRAFSLEARVAMGFTVGLLCLAGGAILKVGGAGEKEREVQQFVESRKDK